LWAAARFVDNKDDIAADFEVSAVSHVKHVVSDLLKYAKEVTREEKIELDEGVLKSCLNVDSNVAVVLQLKQ
jgi:hypothetical protein